MTNRAMSSRDNILAAIRANKPALRAAAPAVPCFDADYPADTAGLIARFRQSLEAMGGRWLEPAAGQAVPDLLADQLPDDAAVCSNVPEYIGQRVLRADTRPTDLADVDTAIVRARFGVAETGSVCFTENELGVNALGYLAQHLIVLLDPDDIVTTMHRAYRRRDYQDARYTVFHTGPSATADIQGVLVRGAQGVRSLTVIPTR